jgi:crotonobetainyl-CoA:carnitine CoA-transferase CaiB-like acyl-CoA transferase
MEDPRFHTNADRLANRAALKAEIETTFERDSLQALIDRLVAHKVPCGRVRTIVDAIADPQVTAREMLVTLADAARDPVINLGTPVKLSRTPAALVTAPPRLGEHTDDVLSATDYVTPRVATR